MQLFPLGTGHINTQNARCGQRAVEDFLADVGARGVFARPHALLRGLTIPEVIDVHVAVFVDVRLRTSHILVDTPNANVEHVAEDGAGNERAVRQVRAQQRAGSISARRLHSGQIHARVRGRAQAEDAVGGHGALGDSVTDEKQSAWGGARTTHLARPLAAALVLTGDQFLSAVLGPPGAQVVGRGADGRA